MRIPHANRLTAREKTVIGVLSPDGLKRATYPARRMHCQQLPTPLHDPTERRCTHPW
ncbi:hypothetical protein [Paraburkholderia sp.]|uniref:hypothetical protein n=1 Tax=Paraburkholderia sp. TaxID=1926495 RepID=UPI002398E640|nr:hypothetical protein [Paraburkholderia sp.]MDE1179119.1 hypothetical protein [Paraburkholderia sp.]